MTEEIPLEPGAVLDANGVHVLSKKVANKLEKKNLSASLITGLEKCAASWFADSFIIREIIDEEKDTPGRRGNLFHKVMEDFFALEPEERVHSKMKETVDLVLASDEYKDLAEIPEVVDWLKSAINGYYQMGGKPEEVKIAKLKNDDGEETLGLEVFVKGKLGETKRDILGFVDRIIVNPKSDDSVVVEDWKSGTKSKRWNPKTKSDDGFAEARQQIIYAELLKAKGLDVAGARLIYPVPQDIVNVPINDKKLVERVYDTVLEADAKLDIFIERNTFEYTPSFLCAWCPLAKICPAATIKPYAKMQDAFSKQPDPEILLRGFEIR